MLKKQVNRKANTVKRNFTSFRIKVRSRHPSHDVLRDELGLLPFRSVVRLGSTTTVNDNSVECNSIQGVQTSSNKHSMKKAFNHGNVKTSKWLHGGGQQRIIEELGLPVVAKSNYGSRGKGNTLLKTEQELQAFLNNHNTNEYIFEKYYNYNKEYRLHVSVLGDCFYACRKMLKTEFKNDPKAWQRHDDNCVWILETNPQFEKPSNWNDIVNHCVAAIKSVGLDIGACDVRVQNEKVKDKKAREQVDFVVLETNSAPSFGDLTKDKYLIQIPKVLRYKAGH